VGRRGEGTDSFSKCHSGGRTQSLRLHVLEHARARISLRKRLTVQSFGCQIRILDRLFVLLIEYALYFGLWNGVSPEGTLDKVDRLDHVIFISGHSLGLVLGLLSNLVFEEQAFVKLLLFLGIVLVQESPHLLMELSVRVLVESLNIGTQELPLGGDTLDRVGMLVELSGVFLADHLATADSDNPMWILVASLAEHVLVHIFLTAFGRPQKCIKVKGVVGASPSFRLAQAGRLHQTWCRPLHHNLKLPALHNEQVIAGVPLSEHILVSLEASLLLEYVG